MRTILVLVLLAFAGVTDAYSLLEERVEKSSLERCIRRCEKNNPAAPTATPRPTAAPLPCEKFDTTVVKDFVEGQERMLCFDVQGAGPPVIISVGSQNHGNVQCAQMQTTMIAPSGETYDSVGSQPAGAILRSTGGTGRWYFWAKLLWGTPGPCRTYTFTVVK